MWQTMLNMHMNTKLETSGKIFFFWHFFKHEIPNFKHVTCDVNIKCEIYTKNET